MSGWDTSPTNGDLNAAEKEQNLKDLTAAQVDTKPDVIDPQAHGWVKPTNFKYSRYVSKPAEEGGEENGEANGDTVTEEEAFEDSYDISPKWAANARRYEWKDEYGDVAPRIPELEEELFCDKFRARQGGHMTA
jgi:hypothetical protein